MKFTLRGGAKKVQNLPLGGECEKIVACPRLWHALCEYIDRSRKTTTRFLHLFKFGLVVLKR